ncbi:hypothetical protein BKA70DRAFT_1218623 [Coprinopsis sp. MPI-PUGE-AT-0042]|nr:hypothetical protein BKA70DRAFT_1218623 [Coprinopsis sp. MPI-PUGE-AT-0042]
MKRRVENREEMDGPLGARWGLMEKLARLPLAIETDWAGAEESSFAYGVRGQTSLPLAPCDSGLSNDHRYQRILELTPAPLVNRPFANTCFEDNEDAAIRVVLDMQQGCWGTLEVLHRNRLNPRLDFHTLYPAPHNLSFPSNNFHYCPRASVVRAKIPVKVPVSGCRQAKLQAPITGLPIVSEWPGEQFNTFRPRTQAFSFGSADALDVASL